MIAAIQAQVRIEELVSSETLRIRIELRAIADVAEQFLGLIGTNTQNRDVAARGADQAGHQVHQRGLARSVRAHQAGDSGRNRQIHAIDAQNVAVEFGNVLEHDSIVRNHYRITSYARTFLFNSRTHMPHITNSPTQALSAEMSIGDSSPNNCAQTRVINAPGLM